jgi:hypothetical protein
VVRFGVEVEKETASAAALLEVGRLVLMPG